MFKKWQPPLTVVCFFAGILIMVSLRAYAAPEENPVEKRNQNLIKMINSQEKNILEIENKIVVLRDTINSSQNHLAEREEEIKTLSNRLRTFQFYAGLNPVKGPGLVITINDNIDGAEIAKTQNPDQYQPKNYIIHDKHLLYLINELKIGGAEAIAINNQRLVSSTDIRCAGTMILVNTTRLAPPYTITVIGNPDRLEKILQKENSEFQLLQISQFPVTYKKEEEINIPAYKGSYQFRYASTVKEGDN